MPLVLKNIENYLIKAIIYTLNYNVFLNLFNKVYEIYYRNSNNGVLKFY